MCSEPQKHINGVHILIALLSDGNSNESHIYSRTLLYVLTFLPPSIMQTAMKFLENKILCYKQYVYVYKKIICSW